MQIVHMQPLVSSLSASDRLVQPLSSLPSACSALSFFPKLFLFTLMKEAASSSTTSVPIYQITRRHVLAVYNFCIYFFSV